MNTKTLLVIFAVLLLLLTLLSAFGGSIRPAEMFFEEPAGPTGSMPSMSTTPVVMSEIVAPLAEMNPPSVSNNPIFQGTSSSDTANMMASKKEQFFIEPFEEEKINESNFAPF